MVPPHSHPDLFLQDVGVPEGALSHFSSLLFNVFFFLINLPTFVDQVTSSGRLAQICVSSEDDVDVNLFLSHLDFDLVVFFMIFSCVLTTNPLQKKLQNKNKFMLSPVTLQEEESGGDIKMGQQL